MSPPTFSEAFCALHHTPPERYQSVVIARSLYLHARLVAPLLRAIKPDYFEADLDLVQGAGNLRRERDFENEADDFVHHPANRGFLRQALRLRVSTQRLRHLVREALHPASE